VIRNLDISGMILMGDSGVFSDFEKDGCGKNNNQYFRGTVAKHWNSLWV
jgi:hypothetical protein